MLANVLGNKRETVTLCVNQRIMSRSVFSISKISISTVEVNEKKDP